MTVLITAGCISENKKAVVTPTQTKTPAPTLVVTTTPITRVTTIPNPALTIPPHPARYAVGSTGKNSTYSMGFGGAGQGLGGETNLLARHGNFGIMNYPAASCEVSQSAP